MHARTMIAAAVLLALCALGPARARALDLAPLMARADQYLADGRYLEALSFYGDVAVNTTDPVMRSQALLGQAAIFGPYLRDTAAAEQATRQARAAVQHVAVDAQRENDLARRTIGSHSPVPALPPTAPVVRVLVWRGGDALAAGCSQPVACVGPDGLIMARLSDNATAQVDVTAAGISIAGSSPVRQVEIDAPARALVQLGTGRYCGRVMLHAVGDELLAVNHLELEQYLRGVLPREMASSWPAQALRAQAVAARTYALYHALLRQRDHFDLYATTTSQVYGGPEAEHPRCTAAVIETAGQVLVASGQVALPLYHANSGATVAACAEVWGGGPPHLPQHGDIFSQGKPGEVWSRQVPAAQLCEALAAFGFGLGAIDTLTPRARGASGRISRLEIAAGGERLQLSGNSFRLMAGPGLIRGADFTVEREDDTFVFKGRGYGHGVGMSQWGAHAMARGGSSYPEILAFYYPGTEIVTLGEAACVAK